MANLNNLPVELILDIIAEVAPGSENKVTVGNNAAWTPLEAYHTSLKPPVLPDLDDSEPLPRSLVVLPVNLDLLSLRAFVIV